ncbi:MAG: repeat protein, partial [Chthonomonadales bacterium]|nr:repeat protein [Chthonomonadales bacterium]
VCRHTPENSKHKYFTLLAGNGTKGNSGDNGDSRKALLNNPHHLLVLPNGDLYVADTMNNRVRKIDARTGRINAFAGTGTKGYSGDDVPALQATLRSPKHICVDPADNVYIADSDNHAVRKYLPATGQLVRVAGTGTPGTEGTDGPPLKAQLNQPHGVYVNAKGILYIADSWNDRLVKITP